MHTCSEECVCPIHEHPLVFNTRFDDHFCIDASCVFFRGMKSRKTKVTTLLLPGELEE